MQWKIFFKITLLLIPLETELNVAWVRRRIDIGNFTKQFWKTGREEKTAESFEFLLEKVMV